jgi:2-iminoacetate synthase
MMGYSGKKPDQDLDAEQFQISDNRSLSEVMEELIEKEYLPSFCTACYRTGRTGEHFMEFSVPGFIKRYCTPNALLTLAEYLEDYARNGTREKGYQLIARNLAEMEEDGFKAKLKERLELVKKGERDLYF